MITREDLITEAYRARIARVESRYEREIDEIESKLREDAREQYQEKSVTVRVSCRSIMAARGVLTEQDLVWYLKNHGYRVSMGDISQRDGTMELFVSWR